MQVFLSYRRKDSAFAAQALNYALRLEGHEVFLDTGAIAPGEAFRDVIRDSLKGSGLVLALVGNQWEASRLHAPLDAVAFELRQARLHGCTVHAVLLDGAPMPLEQALPDDLRWFCKRTASTIAGVSAGEQIDALIAQVPLLAARPRGVARVLWVDDNPANNESERSVLRRDGIVFDNVVSTREAIEQIRSSTYDLVITDLGRRWSSDRSQRAGRELLDDPVIKNGGPPVIVYAGSKAVRTEAELLELGAYGATADFARLLDMVRAVLGRP
jgi:CheY-like chemotaxis protein